MEKLDVLKVNALMLKDIRAKIEEVEKMIKIAEWVNRHEENPMTFVDRIKADKRARRKYNAESL